MLRLLVADDNPITLDFLGSALGQLGWEVVAVADGALAVVRAADVRFDVLLLDARMPILDGPSALKTIRGGSGKSAHSPALATTASTDRDTHEILLAAGFDAVLPKPISVADLANSLRDYQRHQPDDWFDDTSALAVIGGDASVVKSLRSLLLAELERLPGELAMMAIQTNAHQQLDQRMHRLAASAGFCGAVELENAVRDLQAAQQAQAGWPEVSVALFGDRCERITHHLRDSLGSASNGA